VPAEAAHRRFIAPANIWGPRAGEEFEMYGNPEHTSQLNVAVRGEK
jgi:hypothetical protein